MCNNITHYVPRSKFNKRTLKSLWRRLQTIFEGYKIYANKLRDIPCS